MRSFRPEDLLSRTQEMLLTELDQDIVLMDINAGAYYGLAGTARSVWEKLETPMTFSALVGLLVEEYEITHETCAANLQEFLGELERKGLLHVE
jgi:hypothetical protein